MDAVLLAGGYGTRLRPLTYTRPKPLLPVAGKPMLAHVVARLPKEVTRLVVAVNWLAEELEEHFQETDYGVEAVVVREEEPLGTAGAVRNCERHLQGERFFVLNADIVSAMDLGAMLAQHRETGGAGTIALKEVAQGLVRNFGVVALDPQDPRRITKFVEKPKTPQEAPSRLINAGAYLLERDVLNLIPRGRLVSMEKDIFPQLLGPGLFGWRYDGLWVDVGDPVRLQEASHALDAKHVHGPGARLGEDVVLKQTVAGRNLVVGDGSRIERCVLGDDVTVDPESFLVDCVVGDGERVGGALSGERVWTGPVPEGYPQKQVGNAIV